MTPSYSQSSRFPETEKLSPPLLQLSEVTFGYDSLKIILNSINIDVGLDSRIAIVGSNGAGKSTLWVILLEFPTEVLREETE
jgi:ATP-binding cassette subfamily F protein 3